MQKTNRYVLRENDLYDTPDHVRSPGGIRQNVRIGKYENTKERVPRLTEIFKARMKFSLGGGQTSRDYFSKEYKKPPLVTGLARMHDGRIVKLPHGYQGSDFGFVYVARVTRTYVEIQWDEPAVVTGDGTYKLFVYNIDLTD